MPETTTQMQLSTASVESDIALDHRVFRVMLASTILASGVAAFVSPWRVVTGLILGGALALFSHHWLKNSAAAAISFSVSGGKPRLRILQFLLRYVVIAVVVFAAYKFHLVSLPAVLVGLATFVVALLAEAFRAFYFAIIQREEIS
jgi:hypothetical protein